MCLRTLPMVPGWLRKQRRKTKANKEWQVSPLWENNKWMWTLSNTDRTDGKQMTVMLDLQRAQIKYQEGLVFHLFSILPCIGRWGETAWYQFGDLLEMDTYKWWPSIICFWRSSPQVSELIILFTSKHQVSRRPPQHSSTGPTAVCDIKQKDGESSQTPRPHNSGLFSLEPHGETCHLCLYQEGEGDFLLRRRWNYRILWLQHLIPKVPVQ